MKTNNRIIALLLAVTAMSVFAANAMAVGTAAGTLINNTATVNYQNVAGTNLSAVSNTVTTTVTQVAAVTVTNSGNINVAPGQQVANFVVITNGGNGADKFNIPAPTLTGTLAASATLVGVYINPVTTASSTTFAGTGTATQLVLGAASAGVYQTPSIDVTPTLGAASGGAYPQNTVVFFVYSIPNAAVNGDTLIKNTSITSNFDATKTVVSGAMTDTVQAGVLPPPVKSVRNAGPLGTASSAWATNITGIPGDVLEYQIVVTNTGAGDAQQVRVSDAVDANTTFVAGSVVFVPAASGSVSTNSTATALDLNIGTGTTTTPTTGGGVIGAGQAVTIRFQVTIN